MTKRNLIRVGTLAVIAALWSAVAPPPAKADTSIYVTGGNNEFGTLDLTTGSFSQIATLALPSGDNMFGMGYGTDGKLYGVDSQPDANLYRINPTNGGLTDLGTIGQSAEGASSDASGKLFVLSTDVNAIYYTMNPPSTTPNVVATTAINTAAGLMAVSADGTQLFASATNPLSSTVDLYSINPTTGAANDLGNTNFVISAGLFVGGTLYGFDPDSLAIVTLNTSTGAGTQVGTYSLPGGDPIYATASISSQAVPEPSSLVLGLIGTVLAGSLGLIRHRCRT